MKDKKEMYKFSVMHTGFVPYLKVGVQSEPEKKLVYPYWGYKPQ